MLVINRVYIMIILCAIMSVDLCSQIVFEGTPYIVEGKTVHSGVAMGFTDMNGDALDDLIILDQTRNLYIHFQTEGHKESEVEFIGEVGNGVNWSLQAADIDGNGQQDIFASGPDGMHLRFGLGMVPSYISGTVNAPNFLSQGSNFADIDRDGDLDLFVCDDDAENFVALNNGVGRFSEVQDIMDFSTVPPSDGSGNYGSVWSDFDRDGDLDLYISKCRLGTVPGDPERTNQFFRNTDTGFVRIYEYPELLSNDQSWVADFVDVDNDGDWDLLLANHHAPMNLFIQQDDGTFIEEAAARGIAFEAGVIQLVSADFDNDGDVDVFVPGTDHILFENDGNGFFSDGGFPEGVNQIESATCGDVNNDGRLDIYGGYAQLYNNPTIIPDQLFINNSSAGNYIKFSLRTNSSNTYAIGATIEIFHGSSHQMREIRSGESYGINKSNIVHFGLGDVFAVDSVKVFWPSGNIELFEVAAAGLTYQIVEGGSMLPVFNGTISADKSALCIGDSVLLTGPGNADQYRWSTGDTTMRIKVFSGGMYTLQVRNGDTWLTLPTFNVSAESTDNPKVHVQEGDLLKCMSEKVVLTSGNNEYSVIWNSGETSMALVDVDEGSYYFTEQRTCGDYYSDTVTIINYHITKPTIEHDTVAKSMPATIDSDNDQTIWVADTISQLVLQTGSQFVIDSLFNDSLVFAAVPESFYADPIAVGIEQPDTNIDGYHNTAINAGMFFTAVKNCELQQATVYCRQAGPRTIIIRRVSDDEFILNKEFEMIKGFNTLDLSTDLIEGEAYLMTTDENANLFNFGYVSPDFMRSAQPVNYPFSSDLISITGPTFGTNQYYYFYNWKVQAEAKDCRSYWVPARASVSENVAIENKEYTHGMRIFPNPSFGKFNVQIEDDLQLDYIEVLDVSGRRVISFNYEEEKELDMRGRLSGVYIIKLNFADGSSAAKKIILLD